jgi:RNA polymerase sigma-70 factor (ECF subfamily)
LEAIKHPPDLEQLFRDTAADLARYFSRRHEGREAADDLVQETFLKMAEGLARGKRPSHLRAYLFGVARHVSHAAWRQKSKDAIVAQAVPIESIAAADAADERVAAAGEMIARLPALQREVLDLRFNQNLSYAEIAEALGIPVGTVRSRLHHAIAMIRERLDEDNPDTPEKP